MSVDFTKLFGGSGAVLGPTLLGNDQNFSGKVGDLMLTAPAQTGCLFFTDNQG